MKKTLTFFLVFMTLHVFAQRKIAGIVTMETAPQEPLVGISVTLKGTNRGVLTDIDGKYDISIEDNDTVLIFSFLEYEIQEVGIQKSDTINVSLKDGIIENLLDASDSCKIVRNHGGGCLNFDAVYPICDVPKCYSIIGFVKDEIGNPLTNALVNHIVSGEKTLTDSKGIFSIKVFEKHGALPFTIEKMNSFLRFSFDGLKPKEISVGKPNIKAEINLFTTENKDNCEWYITKIYIEDVILEKE